MARLASRMRSVQSPRWLVRKLGPQAVEVIPVRQVGQRRQTYYPDEYLEDNPPPATHDAPIKKKDQLLNEAVTKGKPL